MEEKLEYIRILRALMELPFQVGRNLLADFLLGDYKNKSISKNRLDELDNFDSLNWDRSRLFGEIDRLISNGMIEMVQSDYNRFVKVLSLTIRGRNEITRPTMEAKKLGNRVDFGETKIGEGDREMFEKYADFLEMFNEEQKKAIVSGAKNLLCVAGAGSGKTTVLTKRVEFLVKHKGVEPSKILAITFTRKARREMERRLSELGVLGTKVHTFNSFCERVLQRHGTQIYGRQVRVQSYGDKILAMNMALATMGLEMGQVVDGYFNVGQKKFRTASQLANAFMNDCFAVMDYFKVSGKRDYDFSKDVEGKDKLNAERVYRITQYLRGHMETQGLRDYSDQIIDAVDFFKKQPASVPNFEHVLVDEYQDVNALQIELLGLLNSENLFAVGDPRQSIFGWRGSDVNYILNFEKDFGDAEVVHLKRNYRSREGVIEFMNHAIRDMGLPDLEGYSKGEARIRVLDFESEDAERNFVLREIEDE
ncbi:UvrD-helicase domain-containing protein, partial [archaeon]|nr:UvrD-helicase domain-containing protein [archaeon]